MNNERYFSIILALCCYLNQPRYFLADAQSETKNINRLRKPFPPLVRGAQPMVKCDERVLTGGRSGSIWAP